MITDINKILRNDPRSCKYGAPMGAGNFIASGALSDTPLRCQRLRLIDGDYGADGTYWGGGCDSPYMYCAFNDGRDGDPYAPAMGVRLYVRAWTYEQAKDKLRKDYPTIRFLRGGR